MELKPKVEIKYKGRTLYEGINYKVEYENNVEVGTANVKITGERNFSGEASKEFNINLSPETYNFLDLGEMMGYISIPKISIELPIYEGVTVNNLTKGLSIRI